MRKLGTNNKQQTVSRESAASERVPKTRTRFRSETLDLRCSARRRIQIETLPASNELHGDSADSLCNDNLGLPTQMTNCED